MEHAYGETTGRGVEEYKKAKEWKVDGVHHGSKSRLLLSPPQRPGKNNGERRCVACDPTSPTCSPTE